MDGGGEGVGEGVEEKKSGGKEPQKIKEKNHTTPRYGKKKIMV